ncbi:MAG TPA: bifunctional DNA primase/polymerase [Polyangiaceae bacterium]
MNAPAKIIRLDEARVERAAIRAADGLATPDELRLLEADARQYGASWSALARVEADKRAALSLCAGLGMHVLLLHAVDAAGACACGKLKCANSNSRGKHPIASAWQTAAFDFNKMDSALKAAPQRYNLGWRMGEQLDGSMLVCFDIDGPLSLLDPLESEFGKLPETLMATSGRGFHLFFRLAKTSAIPGNTKLCGVKEIDIRSVGGQVVIAPSRHYSGSFYKWVRCIEPAEIDL